MYVRDAEITKTRVANGTMVRKLRYYSTDTRLLDLFKKHGIRTIRVYDRYTRSPCQIGTITVPVKSLLPFFVSRNHESRTTYVSKINCCFIFFTLLSNTDRGRKTKLETLIALVKFPPSPHKVYIHKVNINIGFHGNFTTDGQTRTKVTNNWCM